MPYVTDPPAVPVVVDTTHFVKTGQRLDLADCLPWRLDGYDAAAGRDVTTTHEGPIDRPARRRLADAYPGVITWYASPAQIDETYTDSRKAAYRICQLLGVELATARAIQTIAADDILGFKFTHGQWEVTGDDDDQSFRIRSVKPGGSCTGDDGACTRPVIRTTVDGRPVCAGHDPGEDLVDWAHVPMCCTACGKPAKPIPGTGDPARGMAGRAWMHAAGADATACPRTDLVTVRVDA